METFKKINSYFCFMKETERELVMKFCKLFGVVEIEKKGIVTYWRWDFELDKLVRFR